MNRDRLHARGPARTPARFLSTLSIAAVAAAGLADVAVAQSPELLKGLNAPWALVAEQGKSAKRIFTAYLDIVTGGGAVLDTQLVTILVPPDNKLE